MTVAARLIASIALPSVEDEAVVHLQWWPDRVLWIARTDTRVIAYDLDRLLGGDVAASVFPAPWPREVGRCTVSPDLSFAVFSGVASAFALRPDADGAECGRGPGRVDDMGWQVQRRPPGGGSDRQGGHSHWRGLIRAHPRHR